MGDFFITIKNIIKKGGISFLLMAVALFFSADSISIYWLILFGISQIPLIFRCKDYKDILPLVFFSVSYSFIWYMSNTVNSNAILFSVLICPSVFYLFGSKIGLRLNYYNELPVALLLLIFLMLVDVFDATLHNIMEVGIVDPTRQLVFDGEESVSSATVWGLLVSPALGLLIVPLFVKKPISKIWPVLFTIVAFLSLLTVIHVVNRGGLVIAVFAVFTALLARYWDKKIYLLLALIITIVSILYFLPSSGDIFDAYSARRNEEGDGERFYRWVYGLSHLFSDPLGWNDTTLVHQYFMHNLWLDVARVTGIIPFSFLLVASIKTVKKAFMLFKISNNATTIIILCIYTTTFLSCFMEPALEAKQVTVFFFIFIWGVIDGVLKKQINIR